MAELQIGPLVRERRVSLQVEEAVKILKTADHRKCIQVPPDKPSGGDIYIYKPADLDDADGWKEDGLQWRIISSVHLPRRNPVILKRVYALVLPGGKVDKDLKKEIYCEDGNQEGYKLALLHYLGNFDKVRSNSIPVEQSAENDGGSRADEAKVDSVVSSEDTEQIQEPSSTGDDLNLCPTISSVQQDDGVMPTELETEVASSSSAVDSCEPGSGSVESTKQAADSSTGSGELETAWKTLQTALGKKTGAKPVVEMVNKLLETVTGKNAEEKDYCLVVSDKKSGKSSVIGSPNIAQRRSSRKRLVDETDENEELDTASLEEQFEEFSGVISDKDPAIKDIHSITELGEQEVLTATGEVVKFPKPVAETYFSPMIVSEEEKEIHADFFDKRRAAKNPQRYLKIRNHIITIWQQQKPRYVSISQARKGLRDCGDVTPMSRIHKYLECKGIINFAAVKSRPWMRKDKDVSHVTRSESKRRKVNPARGEDLERSEEDISSMESDSAPDTEQTRRTQKGDRKSRVKTDKTSVKKKQGNRKNLASKSSVQDKKCVSKSSSDESNTNNLSDMSVKTPTKSSSSEIPETRSSGRRTRNISTPNWADIISGRKSFKKDGGVLTHVKTEPADDELENESVIKSKEKQVQNEKQGRKEKPVQKQKSVKKETPVLKEKSGQRESTKAKAVKVKDNEENDKREVQVKTEEKLVLTEKREKNSEVYFNVMEDAEDNTESMEYDEGSILKENDMKEDPIPMEVEHKTTDTEGLGLRNRSTYKFTCTECDRRFCVGYLFEEHMRNVHSKSVDGVETEDGTSIQMDNEIDDGEMYGDDDDDYADDVDEEIDDEGKSPPRKKEPVILRKLTKSITNKQSDSEKPKCNICGQVFLSFSNLSRHNLLHTNKMYECPFCAKLMKRKDYVKQHVRKVHKDQNILENPIDFDKYTHIVEPEVEGGEEQKGIKTEFNDDDDDSETVKPYRAKVVAGLGKKVCPECSKLFDTQEELEQHMIEVHNKELKDAAYTCQACKKQFKTLVSYQVHKLSHRKKDYVCQHCGKKFVNNSQLQVHRRHDHQIQYGTLMYFGFLTNEGRLSCEICSQDFNDMEEFHQHRPVHLRYKFLCKKCGNGFTNEEDLQAHIDSDCSQVNLHAACGVCDMKFSMYDTRRKHVVANHPKETDFFCHHCGISFEDLDSLTNHFPVHKEEKIFVCEFCNKKFFEKRNLVDHRELHRSSKNWQCEICDRFYISSKSLQRHIKLHLNRAEKNCRYCDTKFQTNQELDEHMLESHPDKDIDNKYHTCKVCCRSFLEKSRLMRHMQVHNGDNTYKCDLCNETFDATYLPQWKHLKKAHPEEAKKRAKRIFECDHCPFSTEHKQRIERHLETHRTTKDFECEYCNRKYQTTSSLMTHMIVHRGKVKKGAKPGPVCSWGTCNKQYMKHSLYKRHLISHIFKVKVGKDLCECGSCTYSAPQPGQPFFLQEDTDYSAVGFVDEEGNPLVATKLENPQEQNVINVHVLSSGTVEQGYESMDVLQEAIAQIEDIENKNNSVNGRKNEDGLIDGRNPETNSESNLSDNSPSVTTMNNDGRNYSEDSVDKEEREIVTELDQNQDEKIIPSETKGGKHEGPVTKIDLPRETVTQNLGTERVITASQNTSNTGLIGYKYECGVCELMFQYKCHVLIHLEEEHPEHRFPLCPTCGKCIIDKKNLRDHMYIHEETKGFKCNVCNKDFRTKQCLRQHSYVHAVTKPFTCNYCGHGFTQKGFYLEHIRRHTGVKPFKCSVCSKAFVSKNLLRIHMFSHANSRPHQCELCPKSFSENYQLTTHMRTHNDDRPFECTECDKAFFVKPKLIRHLNTVHGIDKEELTNYVATRIGEGIGYRNKTKVQNQITATQKTQVVYIDTHGNIVSQELKDTEDVNKEHVPEKAPRQPTKIRPNAPFIVMKNTGASAHLDADAEQVQSFEVVTKRNEHGDLQVNAIMQDDLNEQETAPEEQVAFQTTDGSLELNGENYTLITQAGQDDGQVTLIAQEFEGLEGQGTDESQGAIQVITHQGADGEIVEGEQNLQVVAQGDDTEGIGAENFSINIGEDGTVNAADFEKIEALRNMYSDQQIVIVLESQQQ